MIEPALSQTQTAWLDRLSNLNVARTERRGRAPHKPLLLLAILDMIDDGALSSPWVRYSPELFFRFGNLWGMVHDRQQNQPNMRLPFHALGGARDQVWTRFTGDAQISRSRDTTDLCQMDEALWQALQDAAFRQAARMRLIVTYFEPAEQISLCSHFSLPEPTTAAIAAIKSDAAAYKKSLKKGRDARFRSAVLTGYGFTCALTGYRISTNNQHLVVAAHIHPHARSGNDDPRNGLALTPDAHWLFDKGLWTAESADTGFIVHVATGHYDEKSQPGRALAAYQGQRLQLSSVAGLAPDPMALEWHRRRVFLGQTM